MQTNEKTARGRRLSKRRTTMETLDCSLSAVKRLENEARLRKVRLGGRDVCHPVEDVEKVAAGED